MTLENKKILSSEQTEALLALLKTRFHANMQRHPGLSWEDVHKRLGSQPDKLWSLNAMEESGGEADVVVFDKKADHISFVDCSPESPTERRSLCYDPEALASRKKFKPEHSALGMAADMGVDLLSEAQYRNLQALGNFDLKTSSWVLTPDKNRAKGGALFCDRRYDHVFTYHNGADSYYSSRGFRTILKI